MSKKTIHGIYDDDETVKAGAKAVTGKGFKVKDLYSPFPIHGIDPIIGIPRTRIAIASFIYGITGTFLATLMMWYMMINDWPTDIGGKPNWAYFFNVPAFIPVTFESTVLCAAHGMVITFYLRSWILPGVSAKNPDPRTTDNMFLIEMEVNEDDVASVEAMMKETGATEVNVI